MTKHKWHDEIVAWAGGSEIEFRVDDKSDWHVINNPNWFSCCEYRIKKEPLIEIKYFICDIVHNGLISANGFIETKPDLEQWHLKITYQDGKAIKAELPT